MFLGKTDIVNLSVFNTGIKPIKNTNLVFVHRFVYFFNAN